MHQDGDAMYATPRTRTLQHADRLASDGHAEITLDRMQRHSLGQVACALRALIAAGHELDIGALERIAELLEQLPHIPGVTLELAGVTAELAAASIVDQIAGHHGRLTHAEAVWTSRHQTLADVAQVLADAVDGDPIRHGDILTAANLQDGPQLAIPA